VICPRHGARFSIRTGEALTAPACEPTATFPVKVEGDEVFVRDDRWDYVSTSQFAAMRSEFEGRGGAVHHGCRLERGQTPECDTRRGTG